MLALPTRAEGMIRKKCKKSRKNVWMWNTFLSHLCSYQHHQYHLPFFIFFSFFFVKILKSCRAFYFYFSHSNRQSKKSVYTFFLFTLLLFDNEQRNCDDIGELFNKNAKNVNNLIYIDWGKGHFWGVENYWRENFLI